MKGASTHKKHRSASFDFWHFYRHCISTRGQLLSLMKLFNPIKLLFVITLLLTNQAQADDALNHWFYRNSTPLTRVRFAGGLFFGLGTNGTLLTSPDGSNWTTRVTGTTDTLTGVGYLNGPTLFPQSQRYVVVGSSGTILTSTNAINWTSTNVGVGLNDVATDNFGDTIVVAASRQIASQPHILYSNNGIQWNSYVLAGGQIESGFVPSGYPYFCVAIAYDSYDGIFVTAGGYADSDYDIWTSEYDGGNSWTNTGVTGASVTGVASGNGTNIVVGWEAPPKESTDGGYTWFTVSHGTQNLDSDITFGNGMFLLASMYSTLMVATNTLGWQQRIPTTPVNILSVAYGNGVFVGVSGNNSFLSSNPQGIYQSLPVAIPIITSRQLTNTNALDLVISGLIGQEYRLQTSSNFIQWSNLWKYTNTGPTMEYIAPVTTNTAQLFYRVISP